MASSITDYLQKKWNKTAS